MILFDLDGTLVDSARDIAVALTRLSRLRGGEAVSVERVRPLVSLGAATLVERALGPAAGDPDEDLADFRTLLRDAPSDPAIVYPDVVWALEVLVREEWRLAVVTNKPHALAKALLETHSLDHFFDVLVGGDTVDRPKPDPAPLTHALAELGASACDALYVGDSAVDAAAATALSIPLLIYTGGYGVDDIPQEPTTSRFDAFTDLPTLVAARR